MCAICKEAKKTMNAQFLNETETRHYLDQIAAAIRAGRDPDHFQVVLDKILGTDMSEADAELDEAWESGRRRHG